MKRFLFLFVFLAHLFVLQAQEITRDNAENSLLEPISETLPETSIFDLEEPLDISLKYDITSFIRHKSKGEYLPAKLNIHLNETDSIVKNIRLKARGNFRRGHCFFPPIYLNFKTDPIKTTELEGIRKIKMVTHCSTSKSYQNYILKEYLAYKIFNILSDKSFRVRMLCINYIDTGKKARNYQQRGFLIEPVDLLVKRHNSIEVDGEKVRGINVKNYDIDVVALFNYMIANTDWRAKGGHNMKYIKPLEVLSNKVEPVPYDFDYAGFVGAHYAIPQEWTSIKSTKEREYVGYCRDKEEDYLKVIDLFVAKEEEIRNTITTFKYLDEKNKAQLIKMIDEFYKLCARPKVLVNILERECRTLDF